MLQLGRQLDLTPKALDIDSGGELGEQHLDYDLPAERALVGQKDPRHSTPAELPLDQVCIS
jgi:hypothetical protein